MCGRGIRNGLPNVSSNHENGRDYSPPTEGKISQPEYLPVMMQPAPRSRIYIADKEKKRGRSSIHYLHPQIPSEKLLSRSKVSRTCRQTGTTPSDAGRNPSIESGSVTVVSKHGNNVNLMFTFMLFF